MINKPLLFFLLLLGAFSCRTNQDDEAFELFNEGVEYSLKATEAARQGDLEKARQINQLAINKFRNTLKIDSTHVGALSGLGHSFYVNRQYREAIPWLRKATERQPRFAPNYRELGISQINLGELQAGRKNLFLAIELEGNEESKAMTIAELQEMSELAFKMSQNYQRQQMPEQTQEYQNYAIGVMMTAYRIDPSRSDIASRISEMAEVIGDLEVAQKYEELSNTPVSQ